MKTSLFLDLTWIKQNTALLPEFFQGCRIWSEDLRWSEWPCSSLTFFKYRIHSNKRSGRRAVASLSLPGGQDRMISSIFPHFPVASLIFPQFLFIFFLILVFRVGSSPTREGPGYATVRALRWIILGGRLFRYLLQGSTQKWMILTCKLIPSHIELSIALWINLVNGWLFYDL